MEHNWTSGTDNNTGLKRRTQRNAFLVFHHFCRLGCGVVFGGGKSVELYLLNQVQLGTLSEQWMLIYIGLLLHVNCKAVKTYKNFSRSLPVLYTFCVITIAHSEGWCWLAHKVKL